jgi:hypothetical protein
LMRPARKWRTIQTSLANALTPEKTRNHQMML